MLIVRFFREERKREGERDFQLTRARDKSIVSAGERVVHKEYRVRANESNHLIKDGVLYGVCMGRARAQHRVTLNEWMYTHAPLARAGPKNNI